MRIPGLFFLFSVPETLPYHLPVLSQIHRNDYKLNHFLNGPFASKAGKDRPRSKANQGTETPGLLPSVYFSDFIILTFFYLNRVLCQENHALGKI